MRTSLPTFRALLLAGALLACSAALAGPQPPGPAALPDDGFAARPLFAPGKRLAVAGGTAHESAPAGPGGMRTALIAVGGTLVALGAASMLRARRRGAKDS